MSATENEIREGMLQWEPGTLLTHELERITIDALADLWLDCYRRDEPYSIRLSRFRERLQRYTELAIGRHPS